MKALILGPHPGSASFSILNYFDFYRDRMSSFLPGWELQADRPGPAESPGWNSQQANLSKTRWENFGVWPFGLPKYRGDMVHIVDQGLAWYGQFLNIENRLITVHDLINYMVWKGDLGFNQTSVRRKLLLRYCVRQIQQARHIVCVSECTAGHLTSLLNIPAAKVTVVPNAVEPIRNPLSEQARLAARLRWFGAAEKVVIHVGKLTSYKNRIGALRAFSLLHTKMPNARMFLVHGNPDFEERAFLRESPCASAITFFPPLTREELTQFYSAADVLIFPSLYEGFGWPPLEAMAAGCPVVCSTRGSLGEVVGDAALTVEDPHNHQRLANSLEAVLTSDDMQRDLRSRGLERIKRFAPETVLSAMADVYRRVAGAA